MSATIEKQRGELTLTEAAALLGRPKITLYKWLKQSDLNWRYVHLGGARHVVVRRTDVLRLDAERSGRARQRKAQVKPVPKASVWWTWSFRVVDGPPAQATLAYRREYYDMVRQWKKGA
jgi:hypothetical protein